MKPAPFTGRMRIARTDGRLPALAARLKRSIRHSWMLAGLFAGACLALPPVQAQLRDSAPLQAESSAEEITFISVPGIPRNVVPSIAQDREGFLWIATGDGLARFDGYRLQMIEREGEDALARNMGWIRAMLPGPDGRLWVGTESSGLAVYDPDDRRIRILGGPQPEVQHSIVALGLDAQGRVWIGTQGGGLLRHDPDTGQFDALPLPGQPAGQGQVRAIATGDDGSIWVGHWEGLARWHPDSGVLAPVPLPPHPQQASSDAVLVLLPQADGRLWLGTQNGQVAAMAPGQPFAWLPPAGRGAVQGLALDGEDRLWVGHRAGLDLLDPQTGQLHRRLVHRAQQPAGLAGNDITQLLRDSTGAMWVSGFGVGLQRYRSNPAISVRGPDIDLHGPLRNGDVRFLLALRDQRVLALTQAGSVAVLDADLRVLGELSHHDPPAEVMAEDAQRRLWSVARGRVQQRERDGRVLREWETGAGDALFLRIDSDGTVWLGAERGLLRWRPGDAEFETLRDIEGRSLERQVFAIEHDGAGGLWVGGRAGLHHMAAGSSVLRPVEAAPGHGLGFPLVLGLLRDRQGRLWLDTPVAGLHRMIGRDAAGRPQFERISVRHGMVGRPFGANLYEDSRGRIWSQAFVYDPDADRLVELRAADGVQIGTPWFRSSARLADGSLLFGGSRGVMRVRPDRFEPSSDQPPLVISSLRVDGLPFQPRSMREGLVLPPGTRSFGVEFAALDYGDPILLRYRYRLAGYDRDWLPSDASFRNPSYSELPPGDYRFEVQATNRSGIWSPHTLQLPVTIEPYWWQAAWLPWALAVLLGMAVWALVDWRTSRLRRRQAQLEAIVAARTAELTQMSLTDPLTGLRNRRYLAQRIDEYLAIAQRQYAQNPEHEGNDLIVFLVDLDHFKAVNDNHGHAVGDTALVHAAQAMRRVFRETDTLLRWGGEEFLVVARSSNRRHAPELAERLRLEIQGSPMPLPGRDALIVTASVGFVAYPPDAARPLAWKWDAALQLADAAMYAAKTRGRNRWVGVIRSAGHVVDQGDANDWLVHPETIVRQSE